MHAPQRRRTSLAAIVAAATTLALSAHAQCPDLIVEHSYPFPASGSQFGEAVDIDGSVVVIGDPFANTSLNSTGVARVYEQAPSGAWALTADLQAPSPQFNARFGTSVAISGDRILVGSPRHDPQFGQANRGAAFLFIRNGIGNWIFDRMLTADDGMNGDQFGTAVDISGDDIVIGAPQPLGGGPGPGRAYVFHYFAPPGLEWVQTQSITPLGFQQGVGPTTLYGSAVAIDGNYMVVGQRWHGANNNGRAEAFRRSGSPALPYFLVSLIFAPTITAGEEFGMAVDIDDATETAIIGAWSSDLQPFRGSAYVYTDFPNQWLFRQRLLASDGGQQDHFGWSVSIEGDTALVGAWGNDSAYEYRRTGQTWTETQIYTDPTPAPGDQFGFAVEIDGDRAAIGNPGSPVSNQSVSVFGSVGVLGTNYGPLTPNTAGPGAVMAASGSASIAANNLTISVSGCPPAKAGLFVFGQNRIQTPLYDGNLLVGAPIKRIQPPVVTDGSGNASYNLDLTAPLFTALPLMADDVLFFQFWYRDTSPAGANLSDGLRVRFCN